MNSPSMTPQELVGLRIQMLRRTYGAGTERGRMTQKELGERLGEYLGKSWSAQAVSEAEKGLRAFRLQELLAIARVLRTNIQHLMTPLDREDLIQISEGRTMTAEEVEEAVGSEPMLAAGASELVEFLGEQMQQVLEARLGTDYMTSTERERLIGERDALKERIAEMETAARGQEHIESVQAEVERINEAMSKGLPKATHEHP